jgi:hypothetical protein
MPVRDPGARVDDVVAGSESERYVLDVREGEIGVAVAVEVQTLIREHEVVGEGRHPVEGDRV